MASNTTEASSPALREKPPIPQGPPRWRSTRYVLSYLLFACNVILFLQRISFSMAIVCMVNHTALHTGSSDTHTALHAGSSDTHTALHAGSLDTHTALDTGSLDTHGLNRSNATLSQVPGINPSYYVHNTNASSLGRSSHADDRELGRLGHRAEEDSSSSADTLTIPSPRTNNDSEALEGRCGRRRGQLVSDGSEDGPLVWSKETQGLLLGALYWGFMVLEIPAGYSVYLASPTVLCGVNMLLISLFHALCHPAALWSPWAVFALRVAMGMSTSFVITCTVTIWGPWSPRGERGLLVTMGFCGQQVANAAAFPLTALLCKHGFAGGWPSVFYVFGLLGVVWSVAWFLLSADSPETHRTIHPEERDYIIATRGQHYASANKLSVPWVKIATSSCAWAMFAAHVTYTWALFLFLSNLPLYMFEVLDFDIKSNGVFSMLPYIALGATLLASASLFDLMVRRDAVPVLWTRRLFIAAGNILTAACLVGLSYLPCQHVGATIALLVVAVGVNGLAFPAIMTNAFDFAPRYAASVTSASIALACLPGILTPFMVAEVTKDQKKEQWQVVFFITAAICVLGTAVFWLFGKTTVQSWAKVKVADTEVEIREVCQDRDLGKEDEEQKTKLSGEEETVAMLEILTADGCNTGVDDV